MAYYVYLLASSKHGTLYVGVTRDLIRRVYQHRTKAVPSFTSRYGVTLLVWFEIHDSPTSAITREKEIKKWRRDWKIALIEESNPLGLIFIPQSPDNLRSMDSGFAPSARPGMTDADYNGRKFGGGTPVSLRPHPEERPKAASRRIEGGPILRDASP